MLYMQIFMKYKTISFFFTFIALVISFTTAFGQAKSVNTKVTGTVIDSKTAEKLVGVTVALEGTKKGAKTNVNGQFSVMVEPGSYTLKVSYLGYNTKLIPNTEFPIGETTKLDITLETSAVQGKEVVVTSKMESETQTAQLLARKKASTMNDVLGADQIKKSPDANSADAIKRISGVTVVDNKYVQIRGTSERYNNALLNGTSLSSSEPDKKSFSFDLLPSNFIDNTIVSKTFTPDLPANFSGGLVQVNTVNFPDKFSSRLSIGTGYISSTTGSNFSTYETGGTDWLTVEDGTRAIPSGFPTTNIRGDQTITNAQLGEYVKLFNNTWPTRKTTGGVSTNFAFSIGDAFEVGDENEFGYIGSLSYRTGFEHAEIARNSYNPDNTPLYEREGSRDTRSATLGGMFNLTYKLSPTNLVSFKNLYNRYMDDQVLELNGADYNSYFADKYTMYKYTERSLYSGQLVGEHQLESLGKTRVDWRLSLSNSKRNEPDLRRFVYVRNLDEPTQQYFMNISGAPNPTYGGRFFSELNENSYEGGIDFSIPLESTKFKVGGLLNNRNREFSARVLAMTIANPSNQVLTLQGPDSIFRQENIGVHGFLMGELTDANDRYDASENVGAAYAMADVPVGPLRIIGGARFERTLTRLNSAYIGGGKVNYVREYNDVLPSLSLIYALNDQMNLRAAASQTVSRPEFREIAPFSFYDFDISSLVQGDTSIERSLVRNLDFRYEWFPTAGELISLSLFHKQFGLNGFMGLGDSVDFEGGAIESTVTGSNSIRSWANSSKPAINYGLEFEVRKNLGFIINDLNVFLFTFNYSRTFSEVDVSDLTAGGQKIRPMQGQSPYTVNVGLLYSHPSWGTSVNALYNTFGKRLVEVNPYSGNIFEFPRNVFDLTISQPLFDRFELKFSAKDILAEKQYFSNEDFVINNASKYDFAGDPATQKSSLYDKYNLKGASYSLSLSIKL